MLNWSLPFNISALDGGLGSTNEYQMAELSQPQQKHMSGFYGNPTHYSTSPEGFENYKLGVEGHEEKPWFGLFGGQEKATDQEIRDELIKNIKNKQWGDDTPLLRPTCRPLMRLNLGKEGLGSFNHFPFKDSLSINPISPTNRSLYIDNNSDIRKTYRCLFK